MIRQYGSKLWQRWLNKRLPPQRSIALHRGNIFIFPTLFGGSYIVVCVVLFVLGTNYQNNLIVMLSMLLFSIFATTMLRCYQNLAGIEVQARVAGEFFAGQPLTIHCQVTSGTLRYGYDFNYKDQSTTTISLLNAQQVVAVALAPQPRGHHRLKRLTLATIYPLGLFRAWSHLDLAQTIVVYPQPLPYTGNLTAMDDDGSEGRYRDHQAGEAFSGLKEYQRGESLKRVAWKRVAQGRGMFTKCFEQQVGELQWLDLAKIKGENLELRLSYLSGLVIELSNSNQAFGLNLAGEQLAINHGNAHRAAALKRLACYGGSDE